MTADDVGAGNRVRSTTSPSSQGRGAFTAGAAKIDITPRDLAGLNPAGGGFTGIHDRLFLRALVLDDGITSLAILSMDVVEVGDMTPLRKRIQDELGIPFSNVLLSGSHSHNAPRVGRVSPGALALANRPEFDVFTERVCTPVLEALRVATANARRARVGVGTGGVAVMTALPIRRSRSCASTRLTGFPSPSC